MADGRAIPLTYSSQEENGRDEVASPAGERHIDYITQVATYKILDMQILFQTKVLIIRGIL